MEDNMEQDMDEDMEDEQTEKELKILEERLNVDVEDYDAHVSKIKLLKSIGELDDLRIARKQFAEVYPLTPELWMEWIKDEINLAESEKEKQCIQELFDTAVKDYLSVDLWLEYCQFSIGGISNPGGIEKARCIFERAIASAGIHSSRGSLLWEAYREFENILVLMQQNDEDKKSQKERVNKLFKRQLSVPLLDMDKTLIEYRNWLEGETIDPSIQSIYDSAFEKLKTREELENQLIRLDEKERNLSLEQKDDTNRLSIYSSYLDLEFNDGSNPARIENLYERRIADLCLHPHVWTTYIDYIDHNLKMDEKTINVCERATRNVPNSAAIWIKYIRALERYEKPKETILHVVEKALSRNLIEGISKYREIWLSFIDYKRRAIFKNNEISDKEKEEIRGLFQKATEHLSSIRGDAEFKVHKYWANIEADRLRCMEDARKIWSEIMQKLGDSAEHWLEYINLEKMYGDTKHLRRLFLRAVERTQDQPERITQAWLQFEREEGSLEQFEECERKVKIKMKDVIAKRKENDHKDDRSDKAFKGHVKNNTREKNNPSKRKYHEEKQIHRNAEPVFKKPNLSTDTKTQPTESSRRNEKTIPKSKPNIAPPPGFKAVPPPPGYKPNNASSDNSRNKNQTHESNTTVFVSNLDFSITEKQINDFFSISGSVIEVRLVKNYAGKSKGFAYVKYSMEEEAKSALKRDKESLCGRPAYISKHDPEKKVSGVGHQFQYSMGIEKNKLYVKDLPQSTTKQDLEKLFGQYGELKDVRLVTYRNGHSKGIAYVEYNSEGSASKAIVQTDGMKIQDKLISVAISNPPARKDVQKSSERVSSLGSASKDNLDGYRGKGRSQIAFVPRSVQKSSSANGSSSKTPSKTIASNSDFRNMVLNKKS